MGGPRGGARGPDPRRRSRAAPRPRHRARPVRDEHAEGAGRHRHDDVPAGARLRADRPRHERARLVRAHAAGVGARCRHARAARTLDRPHDQGPATRVLRDHRGGRGLRRRRHRRHRAPRRRRLRPERREDARHIVQLRELLLLRGQDRRWPGTERACGRARDALRRPRHAGDPRRPRAPVLAYLSRPAPDRGLRGRARTRVEPRRCRGRRPRVHLRMVPLRAPDDRGALLRRGRTADRRGHGVREGAGAVRQPIFSSSRRSSTCWPTRSPSCGPRA